MATATSCAPARPSKPTLIRQSWWAMAREEFTSCIFRCTILKSAIVNLKSEIEFHSIGSRFVIILAFVFYEAAVVFLL